MFIYNAHVQGEESNKADLCCRNIVLRLLFLILGEVVPQMKLSLTETHRLSSIKTPPKYEVPPATVSSRPPTREMDAKVIKFSPNVLRDNELVFIKSFFQPSAALNDEWERGKLNLDRGGGSDMLQRAQHLQTPPVSL